MDPISLCQTQRLIDFNHIIDICFESKITYNQRSDARQVDMILGRKLKLVNARTNTSPYGNGTS